MASDDLFGWVGATLEGKFRVDAVVGEGGFGVVYRGHHLGFDEAVAIKCLKVPAAMKGEERERFHKTFLEEGRLLHRLSRATAGIVQALDVGAAISPSGTWTPYIVLEWLRGMPLDVELGGRRKRGEPARSLADAIDLLTPAARALDVAHAQGVAHRDVKPANLFLAEVGDHRTMKVLDFGIAKVLSEVSTLTQALAETGSSVKAFTPQYGAPEQFHRRFGATGPWTDVYALALVLVEVASGRAALDGSDTTQLFIASTDLAARPTPRGAGLDVPDAVETVMRKALAVDPRERYMRAGAFWDALVAAMPEGSLTTRRESAAATGPRAPSRPETREMPEKIASMATGDFLEHQETSEAPSGGTAATPPPTLEPVASTLALAPTAASGDAAEKRSPDSELDAAPVSAAKTATPETPSRPPPIPPREPSIRAGGLAVALLAVALLGAGAGAYVFLGKRPTPPPPDVVRSAAPESQSAAPTAAEPDMVRVPAGTFPMGTDTGGKTERPVHKVTISRPFDLDRTEVTAAEYQKCAKAGKCSPSSIHGPKVDDEEIAKLLPLCTALDPKKAQYPINCIDHAQAAAYCKFAGKRLPTEAEWEYAARSADERDYPWGSDAPSCERALVSHPATDKCEHARGPTEVGRFPQGKSPFGAVDMAGNVWEWVADGFDANVYAKGAQTDPTVAASGDNGVLRGGSWDFAAQTAKSTFRLAFNGGSASVSTGVRCAKTAD